MRNILATAAAAAALLLALPACGSDESISSPTPGASTTAAAPASEPGGEHNDADVRFAQMMIPHHAQAIEMSDMLLAKEGIDGRVRALAEQIKAAQGPEIEQLSAWLSAWGQPVPSTGAPMQPGEGMDMPGHQMGTTSMPSGGGMEGMMSAEDMQALAGAQGAEAARLFLTQMTAHHEGAVAMAQTEVEDGQNEAAVRMAQGIVDTQQREIAEMRQLLEQL